MWLSYFKEFFARDFPLFLSSNPWNYKNDLCVIGAAALANATGDVSWNQPILDNVSYLLSSDGILQNWNVSEKNLDKVSFGKSLYTLQKLTGEKRYQKAIDDIYQSLESHPRTETGNFWHKNIYPDQVWLDGLYMVMPFYARVLEEKGIDRWNDIIDQFQHAHRLLWDAKRRLYLHACDCSKKAQWSDRINGRSPSVWLRAEGWFLMALVDTYELAREHSDRADELSSLLQNALDGMLQYQVSSTKMFLQVVDRSDMEGNYSETSGSAMVAYSLMKGIRLGMLGSEYEETGSAILDGISETYLRRDSTGWHLGGICASAGLGPGPDNRTDRTGTVAYYLSEKQMPDNQHGAAACMMAFSEWWIKRHNRGHSDFSGKG